LITRAEAPALELLVDDLAQRYAGLAEVMGPEPAVRHFANLWSAHTGMASRERLRQRLYEIRQVRPLAVRPPGLMRRAVDADLSVVGPWAASFLNETHSLDRDPYALVRDRVKQGNLYLWAHEKSG